MNRPARLTQAEIARALRAAKAAGWRVVLRPDGSMEFLQGDDNRQANDRPPNMPSGRRQAAEEPEGGAPRPFVL